ncbi:flagellar basal body L-ring protein FlgH [Malaciobacter marinus]|uniref:Flagellar L-ring protein n=1 Tax=Malaciobacter marinus TaxID=505249 RepID=A0A347TNP9_9BACT|nr:MULTISPECIES: flagellar basal body L-ring protein FlgH [Malaciobacter]AXX88227.1 flagellar outer membrane L-ring protein FlgH [Malaciobacter marinus]PHO13930.1 flagellar biosynthesis protein FlgH [Malaciobacter marinus]PHO15759.1 flagellar biosynthesis protein FlgH [Malaciobacter marinus]RYA24433.1 flagellar biosynthesis protein FlgH [Malaciobacter halophilus]
MKNNYKNVILISLVLVLFSACVTTEEKLDFTKPKMQIPKPTKVIEKKKGSLYTRKGPSLFADKKDLQIGDIIQVRIDESLTSDTNNKRELTRTDETNLGGGLLTPMGGNTLGGTVDKYANKFNKVAGVNFNTQSNSSNEGEVKTTLDESFSTTVSVIIEQTYQNGNYFIKGNKQLLIDGQRQELIITGVIRPYDITPENSVLSSQVANLKILYKKDGAEKDALKTPWGTKLLRKIWPF